MLQTFWDINRQTVRKTIDFIAGAAVSAGVIDQNLSVILVALAVAIMNAVWWWVDNRKKVTVKGLEEAGKVQTAVMLEAAVKAAKKAGK